MANNLIQTTELINKANTVLSTHATELNKAAVQMEALNKQYTKLPSEYIKALQDNAKAEKSIAQAKSASIKVEKDLADLRAKSARAEAAQTREKQTTIRLEQQKLAIQKRTEAQAKREQRLLNRTQGLYNRVQRGVTSVSKAYNDLAIKKALNGKLTQKEELQLTKLSAKINKYQDVLKKVDGNIGKYQRNVGNYGSSWNGLSNSINQLTREAPAFANSVQTGFMALSNNIPILTDEIGRLISANKALQAEGKPTVSVFKQILTSLFSLQTLMSVGITLLVLYGKEIGEWASSLFSASDATSKLAENTKQFREESASLSSQTIPQFQALVKISQDVTESEEKRADAIEKITELYPDFNAEILKEKDNTNLVNEEVGNYIILLGKKAKAQAAMQIVQEKYNELILDEEKARKVLSKEGFKSEEEFRRLDAERNARNQRTSADEAIRFSTARRALKGLDKQRKEVDDFLKIYIDNVDLSTDSLDKKTKAINKSTGAIEKETVALIAQSFTINSLRKETEAQIAHYEKIISLYPKGSELAEVYTQKVRNLKIALGEISAIDTSSAISDIEKFFNGRGDDNSFNPPEDIKSNWKDTFQTITDLSRRAFGIMSEISAAHFQQQYADLEKQKIVALDTAGESATARAEIEEQYEEKRKRIQQKEAEQKKTQAIFDITLDTASAVIRALPNIPLSVAVGALGAAQLAFVASRQVPQFWQGGEVGSMQNIMVNDDPYGVKGSNYKEVIEKPNGQILTPQGKNVKMRVPKGSFVHPTYDAFMNSLDSELISNNIMPVGQSNIMPMIINQGLTKGQIMDVMNQHGRSVVNAINNKESFSFNYDERGVEIRRKKLGRKTKIMNSRYSGKGMGV